MYTNRPLLFPLGLENKMISPTTKDKTLSFKCSYCSSQ